MKPLSIRAGLLAWFVASTTLLLGAFSATLWLGIGRSLRDGLDTELRARADGLLAMCEWDEDGGGEELELPPEVAEKLVAANPGLSFEVSTWPGRRLLTRGGAPIAVALSADPPGPEGDAPRVGFDDFVAEGVGASRLCTLVARVPAIPETGEEPAKPSFGALVRVADDVAPVEAQLARIGWIVLSLAALALVAVLLFGLVVSRRFVRPLHELGAAAAAARPGSAAPMPRRGTGDEVDRLAGILDDSFGALRDALERQARFTADAAHELRNPIASIRSSAEVARRRGRSQSDYEGFFDDVVSTTKRMGGVVDALLLLARMDAGSARAEFTRVDLSALASDVAAAARAPDRDRVRLLDGADAEVSGDERLLRVLLENLVNNALRHAGEDSPVEIAVAREGDRAALSVRDFGPGIPPEHAARVFDRFFRVEEANPNRDGAGLGLSIVAAIARLHGADCRLERLDPGLRVTVTFRHA